MSLTSIADSSSGPALLSALRTVAWAEAAEQVAEALGRIHYEVAAPEILSRMQREPREGRQQVYYARALASLRYKPAVPAIEQLCQTMDVSGDWILRKQQDEYLGLVPEVALMRLTASWGMPSNGIRLLLQPLESHAIPRQARVVAVIENVGDDDVDILGPPGGELIVDGTRYQHGDSMVMEGSTTLRVNDVAVRAITLSGVIAARGFHRAEYQLGAAHSNQLIMRVPSPNS